MVKSVQSVTLYKLLNRKFVERVNLKCTKKLIALVVIKEAIKTWLTALLFGHVQSVAVRMKSVSLRQQILSLF